MIWLVLIGASLAVELALGFMALYLQRRLSGAPHRPGFTVRVWLTLLRDAIFGV